MAVQLPRFRLGDTDYFADLRLGEFRRVDDPGASIVFDSPEGMTCCGMAGIVTCRRCDVNALVSGAVGADGIRCERCGSLFEGADG